MRISKMAFAAALTVVVGISTTGCSTSMTEFWDNVQTKTVHWYDTYINPPAVVDYDEVGDVEDYQRVISRGMAAAETRLTALERFLVTNDHPPNAATVEALQSRFPWLTGMAVVSAKGEILAREPEFDLKQLDFSKILERRGELKGISRDLVGLVYESLLGPEVMLGMPLYRDVDYMGLFVVHFDIRALFATDADASSLVITSRQGVLWPGRYVFDETPLAKADWDSLLADSTSGVLSDKNGEFFWLVRYVGREPLIFAIPIKGAFQENTSQVTNLLDANPATKALEQ